MQKGISSMPVHYVVHQCRCRSVGEGMIVWWVYNEVEAEIIYYVRGASSIQVSYMA